MSLARNGGLPMPVIQTRRRVLAMLPLAGACSLVRAPAVWAAGERLETTSVRLPRGQGICVPWGVAEALLRAEGFTEISYVPVPPGENVSDPLTAGAIDFAYNFAPVIIAMIDRGIPMKVLAGLHVGCFELFVHGDFGGITDLKDKSVGIPFPGSPQHMFLSVIAANVGMDPANDIRWITSGKTPAEQLFIDRKVDAFLGFPPEPQELRARHIGHLALNSGTDQPWSQYFCCMMAGRPGYVQNYPVATKRAVRAMLKTIDLCISAPASVAQALIESGFTKARPEYVLQSLRETPYDRWRDYDPEDTIRFYALRLRDLGFVKAVPQKIIADGTDWRFFNELKRELKA
jgi:NitT/TauT family transport system substrate-binding protein